MRNESKLLRIVFASWDELPSLSDRILGDPQPTFFVLGSGLPSSVSEDVRQIHIEDLHRVVRGIERGHIAAIVTQELLCDFVGQVARLAETIASRTQSLQILVKWREPPSDMRRYDGEVMSFACSVEVWQMCEDTLGSDPEHWCYSLLNFTLSGRSSVERLHILQLPLTEEVTLRAPDAQPSIAVIIPHRHPVPYLETTLAYISRMDGGSLVRSCVGLDVEDVGPYLGLNTRPNIDVYQCRSSLPVGPYVFRQAMIEAATEEFIMFQDSDDVPCADRAVRLCRRLEDGDIDMVGSHELELNEIDFKVRAYRFPIDVSGVLRDRDASGVSDNAAEPFLHATSLIRREAFERAGGFSTNRRIANDSQFLLRASFTMKIANVDAFLYVRRVHRQALTVAPETQNGNQLRRQLSESWGQDFKRIKRGEITLDQSSLIAEKAVPAFDVTRL